MEIFCEFYQISMITYNHMEEVLYHAIHISAFKIDGSSELQILHYVLWINIIFEIKNIKCINIIVIIHIIISKKWKSPFPSSSLKLKFVNTTNDINHSYIKIQNYSTSFEISFASPNFTPL